MASYIARRKFLATLGGAAAWPLAARAQQAKKVSRIGILSPGPPTPSSGPPSVLVQGLRELGYIEGQNLAVEFRWADGHVDRLPELAADLVRAQVDVIFSPGQAVPAAMNATKTIPIVFWTHADPVGIGWVNSLAHPGGNVTGVTLVAPDLAGKRLELLREAVPGASRVAVLINTANPGSEPTVRQTKAAAHSLGLTLQPFDVHAPGEFEGKFSSMVEQNARALHVQLDPLFLAQRALLGRLAAKNHLPAMYDLREFVEAGGLICYGPRLSEEIRRTATHIQKVLRGANPADLPVEQPTKFELVINLQAAKAIGHEIPAGLVLRADKVIE
jgi:putative tryptophan/tyrosine transport system substrate-binding protein